MFVCLSIFFFFLVNLFTFPDAEGLIAPCETNKKSRQPGSRSELFVYFILENRKEKRGKIERERERERERYGWMDGKRVMLPKFLI